MIDVHTFENKTAAYYTLGCKLNFAETSTLGKILEENGIRKVRPGEKADICVVNTCSVTELADKKCRQTIRKIARQHPGAFIVVTGCYAQLKPEEISHIPDVDLILGAEQKLDILQYLGDLQKKQKGNIVTTPTKDIKKFSPSCSRGDRTRYFLKVQDGCDYFCTYCTIPYARGFSRNAPIADLVRQAEQAAAEGGKEIVITGVNIGDYGKTTGESFLDLCRALDAVPGIQRYRISSMEPDLLTDELIAFCAQSRAFMPHFHIPLQSGSDEVLRLMHRRYDKALFAHKIQLIKKMMPNAFIGVDVMVGCRGETTECFDECYQFLESLDVTQLHVFPYSERPGTAALRIPYVVDEKEKKRRCHLLLELSDRKLHAFYEARINQEAEVLLEKATRGKAMHGFTRDYVRIELPAAQADERLDNSIVRVRLGQFNAKRDALKATLL